MILRILGSGAICATPRAVQFAAPRLFALTVQRQFSSQSTVGTQVTFENQVSNLFSKLEDGLADMAEQNSFMKLERFDKSMTIDLGEEFGGYLFSVDAENEVRFSLGFLTSTSPTFRSSTCNPPTSAFSNTDSIQCRTIGNAFRMAILCSNCW